MTAEYRITLPPVEKDKADDAARPVLEKAEKAVGFIPNMYKGMANQPAVLDTYLDGYARFRQQGGFTPEEQEVVFLAISRVNGCDYCLAAHSMIGEKKSGVRPDVQEALRTGAPVPDAKLAALATFTAIMVEGRGRPTRAQVRSFLGAGYEETHILSIILAIAVKTLSNYSNHLTQPEVDEVFAPWRIEQRAAE